MITSRSNTSPSVVAWHSTLSGARIGDFVPERRLAIEMALHEEEERRAMEGELSALLAAWRDAEEVAAIADNLFLPQRVTRVLTSLRQGTTRLGKLM